MSQTVKLRRSATSGSVPTTSALALGELAINTYDGKLYLKKNVSGTETIVEIGANNLADTFHIYEYSVTANTTVFQGSDDNSHTLSYTTGSPPRVAVYLNGLLLDWGTDFTATNGTSVTLSSAAVSGDLVQIQAYKSTVVAGSNLMFGDNVKAQFGDDGDLEIYHNGSNSVIKDVGTGKLLIGSDVLAIRNVALNEDMLTATQNGAVKLFYDNSKKLETSSTGITVTGALTIGTNDLITEESGQLKIQSGQGVIVNIDNNDSGPDLFRITKGSTGSNILQITTSDNSSTFSGKVSSTGFDLDDDYKAQFGTGDDLRLYHNGTTNNSNIENHTGGLFITNYANDKDVIIRTDDGSGGVTEYMRFDGSDTNIDVSQHMRLVDSKNLQIGTGADLQLYHNGSNSYIRNYTGNLEIINEQDDGDIRFFNDNGSGGLTEYVRIDGGWDRTVFERSTRHSDNAVATFGTGEDLQIWHESSTSNSYISEGGAGNLYISANNLRLTNYGITESYLQADANGAVTLYYDGSPKIATKSDGVDITGELQADSLDIDGVADISGNLTVGGNTTITGNLTVNGTQTVLNTATLSVDDLNITIADGAADAAAANGAGITVDGANATLTYTSAEDRWNFNKKLYVPDNIRIAAPGPSLILQDTTDDDDHAIRFMDGGGTNRMSITTIGDNLNFETTGSRDFTFMGNTSGSGNVGIGTTSPDRQLELEGQGVLRLNATGSNTDPGIDFNTSSTNDMQIRYRGGTDKLAIYSYGTSSDVVTIQKSDGNVGIGTTTPSKPLHVQFSGDQGARIESEDNHASLYVDSHTGYGQYIRFTEENANKYWINSTAGNLLFRPAATGTAANQITFNASGHVGIGTTSPLATLHVGSASGSLNSSAELFIPSGDALMRTLKIGHGSSTASITTDDSSKPITFTAGGSEKVRIDTSGRVGIGTDNPNTKLHVYDNVNRTSAKVQNNNHSAIFEAYGAATAIDSDASNGIFLRISGSNKVHLDNNGNFGVNVSDPKAKFQVEEYGIDTTETSTSATTQTVIHTMSASDFRSARFTIQVTNSTDSTYHTTEILMVHDGTTANITEFGKVFTANEEATFDADVSSGNVRLLATPATTDSMEFKVVCHSITV